MSETEATTTRVTQTEPDAAEPVEQDTALEPSESHGDAPKADPEGEDTEEGPVSRQAAKFRKRTRELEAQLAAASETITELRRERAESIAAEHGLKPEALWATTDLDSLLTDGSVDAAKIKTAAEAAVAALGVKLQPRNGLFVPREGNNPTPPNMNGRTRWDNAFKP